MENNFRVQGTIIEKEIFMCILGFQLSELKMCGLVGLRDKLTKSPSFWM